MIDADALDRLAAMARRLEVLTQGLGEHELAHLASLLALRVPAPGAAAVVGFLAGMTQPNEGELRSLVELARAAAAACNEASATTSPLH